MMQVVVVVGFNDIRWWGVRAWVRGKRLRLHAVEVICSLWRSRRRVRRRAVGCTSWGLRVRRGYRFSVGLSVERVEERPIDEIFVRATRHGGELGPMG